MKKIFFAGLFITLLILRTSAQNPITTLRFDNIVYMKGSYAPVIIPANSSLSNQYELSLRYDKNTLAFSLRERRNDSLVWQRYGTTDGYKLSESTSGDIKEISFDKKDRHSRDHILIKINEKASKNKYEVWVEETDLKGNQFISLYAVSTKQ